jgi:hypothetical protein
MDAMARLMQSKKIAVWLTPALLATLCCVPASGQNARQRAALARLSRAHSGIHANIAPANGVEAINAPLYRPGGLAFDAAGNLYIADTDDNVVREVNLNGIVSTVAGDGEQGYAGDGSLATAALLDSPAGVAVDSSGNIYIADTHNSVIREVAFSTRNITTIAGNGVSGFFGDGAAATAAMLSYPTAVAVDSNANVYIADTNNHRIREISGGNINTVAGDGEQTYSGDGGPGTSAGLDSPNGVAVDSAFNIYIGDTHNQAVRMVTFSSGNISTLAGTGTKGFNGDGPATSATLARPRGVAVDPTGIVYVADSDNDRIRTVSGGNLTTVAGSGLEGFSGDTGSASSASLDTPRAAAFSRGEVAIADTENGTIRVVNGGTANTAAGQSPLAETLALSGPLSIAYGTGTLTATFSNGGNTGTGLVTFTDGEGPSPATVGSQSLSGNVATLSTALLSAGTHYLVASYAGDSNNPPVASGVYVLPVAKGSQTISFTPVTGTQIVGGQVTLSATATSGLPVSFVATTSSVCTISGNTLSLIASGSCNIEAQQWGNSNWDAAPFQFDRFYVEHQTQTISFGAIASQIVDTTLPLSATATSGLTVTFASLTPSTCTVSGTTASLIAYGDCTIQASQTGNSIYGEAPHVSQTFFIHHQSQTISFTAIANDQVVDTSVPLSATATSGLSVSFASTTPTTCTVAGASASLIASGSCTITAMQAGNTTYSAAPAVW